MPCGCPYPIAPGMAGMVFREEFINIPTITDNGGVLINSPAVDRGVTLNGTTQYVSYPNRGLGYFPGTGFVVVRFIPQFSADDGVDHVFFASGAVSSPNSLAYYKNSVNRLIATIGPGVVFCSLADFSALWNVGQENVGVVSFDGTSSAMWLNGTSLVVTDTAMVGQNIALANIGRFYSTASGYFPGTIKSIRIGTKPITALDVPVLSVRS